MTTTNRFERTSIQDIVADEKFQPRAKLNESRVREYCKKYSENPERMPPISVYRINGILYVVSGFHRLQAAIKAGIETIDAFVKDGTEAEAVWEALGSNQHGLNLNAGDKKRGVIMALEAMPEQSDNAIAAQIGCSGSLVCKTRRQLADQGRLPVSDTVVGKEGKVQTRRKRNKVNGTPGTKIDIKPSKEILDIDQTIEWLLQSQEHEANPSAFLVKVVKCLYEGLRDKTQQRNFAVKASVFLKSQLPQLHNEEQELPPEP